MEFPVRHQRPTTPTTTSLTSSAARSPRWAWSFFPQATFCRTVLPSSGSGSPLRHLVGPRWWRSARPLGAVGSHANAWNAAPGRRAVSTTPGLCAGAAVLQRRAVSTSGGAGEVSCTPRRPVYVVGSVFVLWRWWPGSAARPQRRYPSALDVGRGDLWSSPARSRGRARVYSGTLASDNQNMKVAASRRNGAPRNTPASFTVFRSSPTFRSARHTGAARTVVCWDSSATRSIDTPVSRIVRSGARARVRIDSGIEAHAGAAGGRCAQSRQNRGAGALRAPQADRFVRAAFACLRRSRRVSATSPQIDEASWSTVPNLPCCSGAPW